MSAALAHALRSVMIIPSPIEQAADGDMDARALGILVGLVVIIPAFVDEKAQCVPIGRSLAEDVRKVGVVSGAVPQQADATGEVRRETGAEALHHLDVVI